MYIIKHFNKSTNAFLDALVYPFYHKHLYLSRELLFDVKEIKNHTPILKKAICTYMQIQCINANTFLARRFTRDVLFFTRIKKKKFSFKFHFPLCFI